MNRKAFSLLEVLVTAVLIALLAVTAYPSLNKMTERQDQATNLEIMKSCFWRGRVLAEGKPSNPQATGIVVEYISGTNGGCKISEQTNPLEEKERYPLSNPGQYNLTDISFTIANTPPYSIKSSDGSTGQVQINLGRKDESISGASFTINVATGTIN